MENQQPEALALASIFEIRVKMFGEPLDNPPASRAAKELRRLHARNQELEAMLDAIGAGGVSAQRVTQAKDHIAQDRKMVAAQEPFGYFKRDTYGWMDCSKDTEGAVALYEAPQPQADARDAQRYRWLRAQPLESDIFCITIWRKGTDGFGDDLRLEELDAAIDAAIAASKEKAK